MAEQQQQQLYDMVNLFNKQSKSAILITRKCSDLKEDKRYTVHKLKKTETSVGDAIIAFLSDTPYKEGEEPKFQVYLPKRFVTLLQNSDLESILPGDLFLVSHGPSGTNSVELTLHINNV